MIQPGYVVYGVWFEPWSPHRALYAVGPRGARCGVDVGTGFVWWIKDPSGFVFSYEESWSVAPPMWMGCPYLDSARRAYIDYLGSSGEVMGSSECAPDPGDNIFPIPAETPGLELGLVLAGRPREAGPTARLHGYGPAGGFGFIAKCPVGVELGSRCRSALALVAWSVGGDAVSAEAVLHTFPITPGS